MEYYHGWRLFQGAETRQVDGGLIARPADPQTWYIEPEDYEGNILYAGPFATKEEAQDAILDLDDALTEQNE